MKRYWIGAALFLATCGTLVFLISGRGGPDTPDRPADTDPERRRIRDFWASVNSANASRLQGDFEAAARQYRDSLALDPRHEDSLYYLGVTLEELGEYEEAAAAMRRLIDLNPASARALSQLGVILGTLAPGAPVDLPGAQQSLLRTVEVNREQAGPFLRLGLLELNQRRFSEAASHFRIAADFGAAEGLFWLGYARWLLRQNAAAGDAFAKVLEINAREKTLAARGVRSEGDVLPEPGKPMAALDRAVVKSMLFRKWLSSPATPRGFVPSGLDLGAGRAAWADYDRDGRPDLAVVGADSRLVLYHNVGGRLADVTHSTGLAGRGSAWAPLWADYDADGDPDLYLIGGGYWGNAENALLRNGGGRFENITSGSGLGGPRNTSCAVFIDVDGDGRPELLEGGAASASHGPLRLFYNRGGRWTEQSSPAGLAAGGVVVDIAVADYNADARPDLFVLLWQKPAILFKNLGGGRFANATAEAGLPLLSEKAFSSLWFDYDRDGRPDLLVTTHAPFEEAARSLLQPAFLPQRGLPRLFRNRPDGAFEEVTRQAGLRRSYGTMRALAADFDGDRWPDLLLVNGSPDAHRAEPARLLRNQQGKEFREWLCLPSCDQPANFVAAAAADFNADGLPDLYLGANPLFGRDFFRGGLWVNRLPETP